MGRTHRGRPKFAFLAGEEGGYFVRESCGQHTKKKICTVKDPMREKEMARSMIERLAKKR